MRLKNNLNISSILVFRSQPFDSFQVLGKIINTEFRACCRQILTKEKSESFRAKNSLVAGGSLTSFKAQNTLELEKQKAEKNIQVEEYQEIETYNQFSEALKAFQKDLEQISLNQRRKIVFLIDEAQVKYF